MQKPLGELEKLELLMFGAGAIPMQERRGQQDFVRQEQMPIKRNGYSGDGKAENLSSKEIYERLGFTVGEVVDDLFYAVTMPEGWTKRRTSHSLWSEAVDAQGRVRMTLFYKAAFYDRDAFFNLNNRYRSGSDAYSEDHPDRMFRAQVADGETVIWQSDPIPFRQLREDYWTPDSETAATLANAWLDEHFPDWRSPFAYWGAS